ncbi:uncharacterized protein JN550_004049 [Neoarthrinium moseri]|uniref:uncharacterized protein n=1 Tax=Neoarthrinium moseri TaxID=1658444 RepID=UPI001FDC0A6E|nr:uncharacterized protein JN550_004049 [Neoarthrinium moseri]KAI1872330.1 hypothetical protein JN550_004049 [Neoarthrinium moseri]
MAAEAQNQSGAPMSFNLNRAASEFSASLIKSKIQQLCSMYDEELETGLVIKIRALLVEVDAKRIILDEEKRSLIEGLRDTLVSLQMQNDSVEATLSEAGQINSKYMAALPSATSVSISPPTPRTPSQDGERSSIDSASAMTPLATTVVNSEADQRSSTDSGKSLEVSEVSEVSESALIIDQAAESGQTLPRDKRPRSKSVTDQLNAKKIKVTPLVHTPVSQYAEIYRKIKVNELEVDECVFKIPGTQKFYILRCNSENCNFRIAELVPFKYKRAFNHFNREHFDQLRTEAYIFENYAYEVEDATEEILSAQGAQGEVPTCERRYTRLQA